MYISVAAILSLKYNIEFGVAHPAQCITIKTQKLPWKPLKETTQLYTN